MTRRFGKQTAPGFADPSLPAPPEAEARAAVPPRPEPSAVPVPPPRTLDAERNTPEPPEEPSPGVTAGRLPARPSPRTPMVEVEVSYERGPAPQARPGRSWLEVWTRNSVYIVDSRMQCLEVRATGGGEPTPGHPFVGTRLVGGQWHGEDGVELSYPLPRPGSCAVFEGRRANKRRFSRTSAVERVVMRLQVVAVTAPHIVPSWEELIGHEDVAD